MTLAKLPGWAFVLALGGISLWVSGKVTLQGQAILEASALAVAIGVAARACWRLPDRLVAGVRAGETPLALGIMLLGAQLDFRSFAAQGATLVTMALSAMLVGFLFTWLFARAMKLSHTLSTLLAVGTTICGGTAVAITAPLVNASDEETSYAVGVITLWGVAAIFIYPVLGRIWGVSDMAFGVFAGMAIHSTPQVVGAAFSFSDLAGRTATAVKLVRNCFIAPMALAIAFVHGRRTNNGANTKLRGALRAFPWFLFAFFAFSALRTWGALGDHLASQLVVAGKFLIIAGMAAVGLNTDVSALRRAGVKPLLVGLAGAVVVAGVSVALIRAFL